MVTAAHFSSERRCKSTLLHVAPDPPKDPASGAQIEAIGLFLHAELQGCLAGNSCTPRFGEVPGAAAGAALVEVFFPSWTYRW